MVMIIQYDVWRMEKIRGPVQMVVPLELCNDFNDNGDNNDKNDKNDDGENDNVNIDNLNPRNDLDDLLDKTNLGEKRKSKRVAATNTDIIRRLNNENFK